jgi:hypothetical protein
MKNTKAIAILLITLGLILAACAGKTASLQAAALSSTPDSCSTPERGASGTCKNVTTNTPPVIAPQSNAADANMNRTDSQGAVTFDVKPINLDHPGDTLSFDVSMNTHSVDLSMDLGKLATLMTDNGQTVQAIQWDGQNGGHHVEGKLTFPATYDGKPLLDGASQLTLTIKNVDASTRLFTWQITK